LGKTTLARALAAAVRRRGRPVIQLSRDEFHQHADRAVTAAADAVLMVDGTFPQGRELTALWDEIVFVDTSFAAAGEVDPGPGATIVIGNDDVEHPVLRRIGGTETSTARLFSYGTLQLPQVQLANYGRQLDGAPETLPGFRADWVTITDPDTIALSGTDRHRIVRHTGQASDFVSGTVFTVTTAELAAADAYEVDDYRRVLARLGSTAAAWVYAGLDPSPAGPAG
jgi:Gamma-glutamyl cyclotransferase, AIG2-like